MPLPAPNLDDRRFQDFVNDAKRLIQRRIPAWTDHNVSDPGITLIEAVATIADQLTFRLNQVPERHHRKFLDLLGITLRPPTAARADLTFRLSAARPEPVTGAGRDGRSRPGESRASSRSRSRRWPTSRSRPSNLIELRAAPAVEGQEPRRCCATWPPTSRRPRPAACFSTVPQPGDRLYVGLSAAAPCGVDPAAHRQHDRGYSASTRTVRRCAGRPSVPGGWATCEVESDSTGGLNRPGDIVLHLPASTPRC